MRDPHVFQWAEETLTRIGIAVDALDHPAGRAKAALSIVAVMLVAALLFLYRLGAAEVCSNNEAVEGLVVQRMVEHGEFLFPLPNGRDPVYKPPLFHWTASLLAYSLGMHEVTELTLRLPSALYALAGVVVTMIFALRWLGLSSAVLSGLVLLASHQYVDGARFGRVDMALTSCEALALFSFLWWLPARGDGQGTSTATSSEAQRSVAHYVFAIALGLGVLAKGPVGAVLPLIAVGVFLLAEGRWADVRGLCAPGPALVLLTLGSSWYVACLWGQRLDVLDRQIASENFSRFFGGLGTMPPWYYAKPLLLSSVPFTLLVPFAVAQALSKRKSPNESNDAEHPLDAVIPRFLAFFWVVTVVVFSLAAYKRRAYLLPLLPPASVLLVWWLGTRSGERRRQLGRAAIVVACVTLIVFNLFYVPHARIRACRGESYRDAAAAIRRIVTPADPLYAYGLGAEPMAPLLFYLDRAVPPLPTTLADTPPGYVLVPQDASVSDPEIANLHSVLAVSAGRRRLILFENRPRASMPSRTSTEDEGAPFP